jgi:hypothetical protein
MSLKVTAKTQGYSTPYAEATLTFDDGGTARVLLYRSPDVEHGVSVQIETDDHVSYVRAMLNDGDLFAGNPDGSRPYAGPAHPEYPSMVWSTEGVEAAVVAAVKAAKGPDTVGVDIMKVLNTFGYDSMDREMGFWVATQLRDWDYDTIYDAWLETEQ